MGVMRNIHGEKKILTESKELAAADVDTDASGDITVTFSELRQIFDEASVEGSLETGHLPAVRSVSGNAATVRIFTYTGGSPTAHASQSNLSIAHFTARGY